jgi:hypothetical protein
MCNTNCCCNGLNKEALKKLSLVFILINTILSFIAIFIRAAKTKRYEQALELLEQRNNGTYNATLYNCFLDGFWHDEIYCDSEGKRLSKPDDTVGGQSLFKKWNTVELFLDISRLIITAIFLIFFYFALNKEDVEDGKNTRLSSSIAILGLLVADSGICILLRALTIGTNQNIGLYELGNQNEFESYTAVNYIIDIAEIVLNCVVICFVIRLQRPQSKEVVVVNQPQPPQPIYMPQPMPQPVGLNIQINNVVSQNTATNRNIYPPGTYGGQ